MKGDVKFLKSLRIAQIVCTMVKQQLVTAKARTIAMIKNMKFRRQQQQQLQQHQQQQRRQQQQQQLLLLLQLQQQILQILQ